MLEDTSDQQGVNYKHQIYKILNPESSVASEEFELIEMGQAMAHLSSNQVPYGHLNLFEDSSPTKSNSKLVKNKIRTSS